MRSEDVELGPVYTGDATIELFDAPGDELSMLRPYEMIAGYWRQVGATFAGGTNGKRIAMTSTFKWPIVS